MGTEDSAVGQPAALAVGRGFLARAAVCWGHQAGGVSCQQQTWGGCESSESWLLKKVRLLGCSLGIVVTLSRVQPEPQHAVHHWGPGAAGVLGPSAPPGTLVCCIPLSVGSLPFPREDVQTDVPTQTWGQGHLSLGFCISLVHVGTGRVSAMSESLHCGPGLSGRSLFICFHLLHVPVSCCALVGHWCFTENCESKVKSDLLS